MATRLGRSHEKEGRTVTVEPTCQATGTKVYKCKKCGAELERETLATVGHSGVEVAAVTSTCKTNGTAAGVKCKWCGTVLSGCEQLELAAHTPVTVERVEAGCDTPGHEAYDKCSVCGAELTEIVVIPPDTSKCSIEEPEGPEGETETA